MKSIISVIFFASCILNIAKFSHGAKILVIITVPSYSHQIPFHELWKALNRRGHEIVLISGTTVPNWNSTKFSHIDTSDIFKIIPIDYYKLKYENYRWLTVTTININNVINEKSAMMYEHPEVKKLYNVNNNQTFDLVMAEFQYSPTFFAFAHRFNAPLIGITTLGLSCDNSYITGEPIFPSHPSNWELEETVGFDVPFFQRVHNFLFVWYHVYYRINHYVSIQQAMAEKYLGKDIPSIIDLGKNVSVIFSNQDVLMSYARPNIPKIIPFSYTPAAKKSTPLSNDLKEFLEDAKDGFIYFSLGTNLKSEGLPAETRQIFCDAFSNLSYKVLWKYEQEMPGKPDNVFIGKWFPQHVILAHPNIKLLIYQGGIQTTQEAIHNVVPVVGIPIYVDQDLVITKLERLGLGKRLRLFDLSRDGLKAAINEVIKNKTYKEKMAQFKALIQDKPYDQIKNLVWWTEYIIRYKGAPHLSVSFADEPWYRRFDMDVVAFLAIVLFVIIAVFLLVTVKCVKMLLKHCKKPAPRGKEKTR